MPSGSSPLSSSCFRILSLDGGGIRGAFAAAFLAEIERQLHKPVGRYFDLIAGTSTGSIIAAALALGESAETVERLYLERGSEIFTRLDAPAPSWLLRAGMRCLSRRYPKQEFDSAWLLNTKYTNQRLRSALVEVYGDRVIEAAKQRLVIPAVDLTQGKTVVFKTPHLPGLFRDREINVVDAVMASSAAPAYFPPVSIGSGSAYCDGGLWANNPIVVAYAEAIQINAACKRGIDPQFQAEDIHALSVGTGEHPYFAKPPESRAGLLWWGPRLLQVVGASHSQGANFQAQYLLGPRYDRINFQVPDNGWKLDAFEFVEQLVHLGRESAVQELRSIQSRYFSQPARAPDWFPKPSTSSEQ